MNDYEEFEIDNIYLLLGHFVVKCQTLYSTLENCGDDFLAMDPDEMDSEVHYIFNIYIRFVYISIFYNLHNIPITPHLDSSPKPRTSCET